MRKFLILLFVCLLVFSGCAKEDVDAETEQGKVEETLPNAEKEPEVEQGNEAPFGLTEKEIECILKKLKEKNFPVDSIEDISDIQCLGYRKIYTETGVEYDYSAKEYGVCLKNGPACNLIIPIEEIE